MHMISKQPETDVISSFTQGAAPADGMPVAAELLIRASSEGPAMPAAASWTSDSALAILAAALAALDAACKHHTSAQDAARALMQQVRRLPCSMHQEFNISDIAT